MRRYYALYTAYDPLAEEYTRPIMALSDSAAISQYVRRISSMFDNTVPPIFEVCDESTQTIVIQTAASALMHFCRSIVVMKAGKFDSDTARIEMFTPYKRLGSLWELLPEDFRRDIESKMMK